jgi:hypothetical protein
VVDKFVESDPEQARWYSRICESFEGTQVTVVSSPWDQALANRVPLDLGAVGPATLDAKLAMAEVVLRGVDQANRRRLGLTEEQEALAGDETGDTGNGQWDPVEPPRWYSQPVPPPEIPEPQEPADAAVSGRPEENLFAEAASHPEDASRPHWPDSH